MDLASGLPAVRADRVEVQQIVVNLLLNGLEAVKDVPRDRREILIRTSPDVGVEPPTIWLPPTALRQSSKACVPSRAKNWGRWAIRTRPRSRARPFFCAAKDVNAN